MTIFFFHFRAQYSTLHKISDRIRDVLAVTSLALALHLHRAPRHFVTSVFRLAIKIEKKVVFSEQGFILGITAYYRGAPSDLYLHCFNCHIVKVERCITAGWVLGAFVSWIRYDTAVADHQMIELFSIQLSRFKYEAKQDPYINTSRILFQIIPKIIRKHIL